MNSLHHPRCKIRTQLSEVLLTLTDFLPDQMTRKATEHFSHLVCLPLVCQLFSFPDQREHRSGEKGRRGMGCYGKQEGFFFTGSHQMHMENYSTSKHCGIPFRPQERSNGRRIQYICHFGIWCTQKTVQWGYCYFVFFLYFHKRSILYIIFKCNILIKMTTCLFAY